jgi:hypothetical protein
VNECVFQKYNSCLETLDLSKNPCCSPGLEGVCASYLPAGPALLMAFIDPISSHSVHSQHITETALSLLHIAHLRGRHCACRVSSGIDVSPPPRLDCEQSGPRGCTGLERWPQGEFYNALFGSQYPSRKRGDGAVRMN